VGRDVRSQRSGSDFVAFKSHYRLESRQTAALSGAVELHLFDGGYAGLQLIEDQTANFCLLIARNQVAIARGGWDRILSEISGMAPILGDRLAGSEMLFDKPLAVSSLPYGYLHHPAVTDLPGVTRLGDQYAVIPSFTGEGMALAAACGKILAKMAARGSADPACLHDELRRRVTRPLRLSAIVHRVLSRRYGPSVLAALAGVRPEWLTTAARLTRT
jgi:hypothetical protein